MSILQCYLYLGLIATIRPLNLPHVYAALSDIEAD